MHASIASERGLTLAEILVALAIIGLGLVGLAVVIPGSTYAVQEGNQRSTATFLAEQMIERTRAASWATTPLPGTDCLGLSTGNAPPVPTGATCNGETTTRFPDEAAVVGYPTYRRVVRVADCGATACVPGVTDARMRLVTVAVTYRGLTAAGQSPTDSTVTLQWLVARK